MKFFKGLIIIYLVGAAGYSMVVIPPWANDALAFKASRASEGYDVLEKNGLRFTEVDIAGLAHREKLWSSASFERHGYIIGYLWGPNAKERQKTMVSDRSRTITESGVDWAISITAWDESVTPPMQVMRAPGQVNSKLAYWHPFAEFRFLASSIPILDAGNSGLLHFPPAGFPIVLLIFSIYPVYYSLSVLYAALIAFSPPAVAGYIVFLPPLLFLMFVANWINRKKRQQPRNP